LTPALQFSDILVPLPSLLSSARVTPHWSFPPASNLSRLALVRFFLGGGIHYSHSAYLDYGEPWCVVPRLTQCLFDRHGLPRVSPVLAPALWILRVRYQVVCDECLELLLVRAVRSSPTFQLVASFPPPKWVSGDAPDFAPLLYPVLPHVPLLLP